MIYFGLISMAVLFGGTFIAGRIAAEEIPVYTAGFMRFIIAAVVLSVYTFWRDRRFPALERRVVLFALLLGLIGSVAYNLFFMEGLKIIPAGRAAVITATNPAFASLAALVIFKEQLSFKKILGILLTVIGVWVTVSKGELLSVFTDMAADGDMYILGAVLCWVMYTLINKSLMLRIPVYQVATLSSIAGAFWLIPFTVFELSSRHFELGYSWLSWAGVIYLGIVGSVICFILFYNAVSKIGISRASVFINLVPLFAAVEAWFILDEVISVSLVVGAALVVCGVFMVNVQRDSAGVKD